MRKYYHWSILIITMIALLPAGMYAQNRNASNGNSGSNDHSPIGHVTHVTSAQALNVGYTFMRTGNNTRGNSISKQTMQLVYTGQVTDSLTGTTTDCYYVFSLQPKGFVIVAADNRVEPILGYSYDNDFTVTDMPDHVRGWLGGYERQIKAAIDQNITSASETDTKWSRLKSGQSMSTRSGGSVGPLLTTTWDQGQYYNSLCPADANGPAGHVYTGCVATAMAQIINYWGYPAHGRGTHSYESNYGTLTVNYGNANYDYTNMPVSLSSGSNSSEIDAVATLMRNCGVAVNMGYSASESGAHDQEARAALINFFSYSPNMSFAEKAYFTNDEWETMLRNDLDAGNPVFYSGQGTGGHAFVCDGYNADGYFSFNFGWGGYCNGWYLTSNVNPGGSTFNDSQSAIFGIVPDSIGNVILGQMAGTSTFTVDEPLEFYHLMGHNAYEGGNYSNSCNSTVLFVPANSTNQIVADILDFEDQTLNFSDGDGNPLRSLVGGNDNDYSPVVSNQHALQVAYSGNLYYAGFNLSISQTNNDGCRMVSNITSHVDSTTVHLTWTENGGATQWEIEYGVKDFELGTGTVYTATINTATFSNLPKFTEYDFYIRPTCGTNQYGPRKKETVMVEAAYWQDIVTSQPEGYAYNAATNTIEISTAEGLAWWAKNVSFGYGQPKVYLTADINLSGYKWRPAVLYYQNFDGQGHQISNAYIQEKSSGDVGFFSMITDGNIDNLGLTNSYIKGYGDRVGGICGYHFGGTMRNCYVSNSTIDGFSAGSVGGLSADSQGAGVINCYSNANVIGNHWIGLMIGLSSSVKNCYAAGTVKFLSYCNIGGVTAISQGEISNCYSIWTNRGVVGNRAVGTIADTSTFVKSPLGCTLLTPIDFDGFIETDLLSALNRGLELCNDSLCRIWVADTGNVNGGYPILGNTHYSVQCQAVSNVSVQNLTINNNNAVKISWTENGNASQWRIRYRRHDRPDTVYTKFITYNNPDTIYGIPLEYTYDFNVRAICDTTQRSAWSETQTLVVDLPYWTDIVTSQPTGYVEDADGNVEIYSTEGLAWFAVKTNGFHGQPLRNFEGKKITLKADINLDGYRWYPIANNEWWDGFSGTFDGQNHIVSNIYSNGTSGLFGTVYLGSVKNVHLSEGSINGGSGGLIGYAMDCYEISNCHSSVTVYNGGGALCGVIDNRGHGPSKIIVSNCSSTGTVYGRQGCGDLIGTVTAFDGDIEVCNCYATGDVNIISGEENAWYRGGLIGYVRGAYINNCFSTGSVEIENSRWYGKVIGALDLDPHVHYIYGQDIVNEGWDLTGTTIENISDTTQFHHDGNTNALLSPVSIDGTSYSDLLDALNAWVTLQNDPTLRTWVLDSVSGYPVFGNYLVPSCYNPTDLTVSQATVVGDATIKTRLEWVQEGEPDHWEVLYVATGQSIGLGTIVSVDSNSCVLAGIPIGQPLDFYVRAICAEDDTTSLCGPVTYIPDKLHWTDVVTSKPEGYYEDADGNVFISSAEGLSWLSSVANELNGAQHKRFDYKQIAITNDIDLSAYRWTAIGDDWFHMLYGSFNGNNHVITGLYCNEFAGYQGLFGYMSGDIFNVVLTQCNVHGKRIATGNGTSGSIGGIVGYASSNNIYNCIVTGNVNGGGIAGSHIGDYWGGWTLSNITNSFFIGNDVFDGNSVGICESSLDAGVSNCYVVNPPNRYYIGETNNSDYTGSGTTWTLSTPQYINGAFRSDLVDALNAWVDANNTDGRYKRWTADTNMVNGGYPVFESVSLPEVISQDTVVAQGYYSWHGMVFTSDTVVTDTISTIYGYDSVVTYHIFVNPAPLTEITVDTCSSYTWNSEIYHETGDYVQTFPMVNDADSIVILHLTINPLTGIDEQLICDNSYTWIDGVTYVANNNTATYTLQTSEGCDSVVTLHLTIGHPVTTIDEKNACESFTWIDGVTYTESTNEPTITLMNAAGCDSVVTLHLTIGHPVTTIDEKTACESFTWIDGVTYTESTNEPTLTLTNMAGCDSVVTLHLTIGHPVTTIDEKNACESLTWIDGNTYTESTNEPTFTLTTTTGCDSVITLHLTINHTTYGDTTAIALYGFNWYEHTNLTQSGNYTQTLANAAGCDSIVTLHLTINDLYWTDVVTSQPEGYQEDENDNVYISSAEGLAWFSSVVNELNGAQNKRFNHIVLTNDIDLSAYRWTPIGSSSHSLRCTSFNGNNHVVSGLICNEISLYQYQSSQYKGLFGYVWTGDIHNLILTQCEVHGSSAVGAIAGYFGGNIYNCIVEGNVSGISTVGGLVGGAVRNNSLENSCFIGTVGSGQRSGGIVGMAYYSTDVNNCFIVNGTETEGVIAGSYNNNYPNVSNCYYKESEVSTPFSGNNYNTVNVSSFSGTGYSWTLISPPYINGLYYTNLVDALNAWVDSSNTDGKYSRWVADTAMVNGGYPIFEAISYPIVHDTVIAHESYSWHNIVFTTDTVLVDTILSSNGYLYVLIHHVIVYHPIHTAITVDTCDGYYWGGTTYNTSGDYTYSHLDANGCTQVDTLHLTVRYSTTIDTAAVACESFTWHGSTYTQSGDYHLTMTNVAICDSVVTLHLTINHSSTTIDEQTACDSYTWIDGNTYTENTNEPTFTLTNAAGCDSVVTLHLTIYHLPTVTTAPVSNIATNWATCGGTVIHDGGGAVTARGVCWSTSQNPTIADAHTTDGTGTGSFTSTITGLNPSTIYYVRAYATNNGGTSYGEEVTFTTATLTPQTFTCGGTLIVGSNSYTTHQYGSQCWMTENLRNANGSERINWPDVLQACPIGWHLPNNGEWNTLGSYMSSHLPSVDFGNGDYWTSSTMPWADSEGNSYTLIAPTFVQSNSVSTGGGGIACEVHDAANCDCMINSCISARCVRDEIISATLPTVITSVVSGIAATSATCGGNITDDGGATVTARGVCWSTSQNPTIADAHTTDGTDMGTFTSNITGLTPNTTFYVRAYATNSEGTSYGQEVSFTTPCDTATYEFNATACNSYTWDSSTYTETGDYSRTYTSTYGCDSVVTLHLTVNHASTRDTTAVACGNFTWYGTTYTQTGDYTRSLTNAAGCDSTVTLHLTIHPIPEVTITGNTNICPGGGTLLTATGADNYLWSTGSTNSFIPVNVFGVYSVTGTNSTGCSNTTAVTVLVTQPPVITITGETDICAGESTTLSSHGGNTYLWNNGSTDSTMTVSGADSWQVIGYDANGCSSMANVTVNVWQPATTSFSATACSSYTWNDSVYTQSGDYTQTFHTVHGCDSIVTLHLTIYPTPAVVISGSQHICETDPVSLTASVITDGFVPENLHFTWYESGQIRDNMAYGYGDDSVYVEYWYPRNEPYHFTVQVSSGDNVTCASLSGEHLVYVHPQPNVYVSATETSICVGGTTILYADATNVDDNDISYSWSVDNYSGSTYIFSPSSSGSFTFTVTATQLPSGCSTTGEITIDVNNLPETPVVTADNTMIFEGNQVTLSVTNPVSEAIYTWYRNGVVIAGANQPTLIEYLNTIDGEPGIYTYNVVATLYNSGCVSAISASTIVTVNPTPVAIVSVEGNTVLCEGNSTTLHVDVTPAEIPYTYQWYKDNVLIPGATSTDFVVTESPRMTPYSFQVVVSANGSYTVSAYAPDITIVPQPVVWASISDESVCVGGTTTLTAIVDGGMAGNIYTFQWYRNNADNPGVAEPIATSSVYATTGSEPEGNYNYWVSVASSYGCQAESDPVSFTVVADPVVSISLMPGYSDTVYDGASTAIIANVTGGYGETAHQWYHNGILLVGETNQVLYINSLSYGGNDIYSVMVAQTGTNCTNTASADINTLVTVLPSYTVNVEGTGSVCDGDIVTLTATVSNAAEGDVLSYQWYRETNGQAMPVPGADSASYSTTDLLPGDVYVFYVMVNSSFPGSAAVASAGYAVVVHALPNITIDGNNSISYGQNTTLTASGAMEFGWSSGDDTYSITVSPTITTTYTVTGTSIFGCTDTAVVTVTVNPIVPTVITDNVSEITTSSAICGGNITSHGGAEVTERGICWSTLQNPTISDLHTTDGSGMGSFVSNITGLVPNTTYYFRAYATNSVGTAYGEEMVFTTLCDTVFSAFNATSCDSYVWNSSLYSESGDYQQTFAAANGCDSVVTLHLTIHNPAHTAVTETACESFTWNGTEYTVSGDYTYSHADANGCTQVDTLHLTIHNPVHTAVTETACESFTWNGTEYTVSGDYTFSHADANGCTQVDTLHLTIHNPVHYAVTETACGSFTWNGTEYTVSGDYTFSHADANGCTQVDTLHLTIHNPVHTAVTETACESFTWNGTEYTVSGDYTYSHADANGCTQVDTLHLTIFYNESSEFSIVTEDSCYTWNDQSYCTSGDYTQNLQSIHGCDSVVTLHLTITVGVDDYDGFDFKIYPNPTSNIVNVQFTMNNVQFGGMKLHLCDAYGRLLDVIMANNDSPLQTAQIDLSRYAKGVYFLKAVTDGKTVAVRKVVKQ